MKARHCICGEIPQPFRNMHGQHYECQLCGRRGPDAETLALAAAAWNVVTENAEPREGSR